MRYVIWILSTGIDSERDAAGQIIYNQFIMQTVAQLGRGLVEIKRQIMDEYYYITCELLGTKLVYNLFYMVFGIIP